MDGGQREKVMISLIPDCLDGIKSFSQNENQKLSDRLIASVRHSKFSTCVNFNKISIIINSWWGGFFSILLLQYVGQNVWESNEYMRSSTYFYIQFLRIPMWSENFYQSLFKFFISTLSVTILLTPKSLQEFWMRLNFCQKSNVHHLIKVHIFWEGHKSLWNMHLDLLLSYVYTLQMFAGIYGDFTGKWVYGGFKFTGITGNLQCL